MNTLMFRSIMLCSMVLLVISTIHAQKPVAVRDFEIRIPNQEEASYREANMRISSESGYPLAIYNPAFKVEATAAEQMAREYLQAQQDLLGLSSDDLANLQLHAVRRSDIGTTVRLRQYYEGLPVNQAEITVTISPENKVCFVMNGFRYGVDINQIAPAIDENSARNIAVDYINPSSISHEEQMLKIFHHDGATYLIYEIIMVSEAPLGEWQIYVDAQTGALLQVEDVSCYYHDHREHLAPGVPPAQFPAFFLLDGSGYVFDPDPLSSANATYGDTGFSDNSDANSTQMTAERVSVNLLDITFDGTNYSLVGPYAELQDFESPNRGLFSQTSSTWNFDRQDAAFEAVNTYYHIDASMRYLNLTLGVNVSPTDYPGGVRFDPHGLGGSDNSHYVGSQQRVAFGEGGVDDAEDSDVIHHELGHGLHDWITNGGLSQVNGLSEGSGDYWAASYNRSLNLWDVDDDAYHWVFIWDGHNPFWNGRRVNYGATYPAGLTGTSIHTDGQIWATCMMKVWDELGRNLTDKAFWEGLGMTNSGSSQDDAANAVYQAALNMNYSLTNLTAMHDEMTNTGYNLPLLPLPVELLNFSGKKIGNQVLLEWTTASETKNEGFIIEHSVDGMNFNPLAQVRGAGESFVTLGYEYLDTKPFLGTNFYRLRQIDWDGAATLSSIITVEFTGEKSLQVYPNPVQGQLFIASTQAFAPNTHFNLYNALGKKVDFDLTEKMDQSATLDVSSLASGAYWLEVIEAGKVEMHAFYKQ